MIVRGGVLSTEFRDETRAVLIRMLEQGILVVH